MNNAASRKRAAAWKRLASSARYLAIRHDMKWRFDLGWPAILTVCTLTLFGMLPIQPAIIGNAGLLKSIHDLIGLLAAFFLAALAAVSTFDRPTLDQPMEGTPPRLDGRNLTRREFVCYLFGYLSVLAFALFLGSVVAEILAPSFRHTLTLRELRWVRGVLGSIYVFAFWNMIVTTMLGIWFLIERVHLRRPRI